MPSRVPHEYGARARQWANPAVRVPVLVVVFLWLAVVVGAVVFRSTALSGIALGTIVLCFPVGRLFAGWLGGRAADSIYQLDASVSHASKTVEHVDPWAQFRANPDGGYLGRSTETGAAVNHDQFRFDALAQALAKALGAIAPPGFVVAATGATLRVEHGGRTSRIFLGAAFSTPPVDQTPRVLRGCIAALEGFQELMCEATAASWPVATVPDGSPDPGARPAVSVQLRDGALRCAWGLPDAPVIALAPIPYDDVPRVLTAGDVPPSFVRHRLDAPIPPPLTGMD